jgi:hypothetical protein
MGYFSEARVRAQRRKSRWNLLLLPAVLVPLAAILATLLLLINALHGYLYTGQSLRNAQGGWAILATVGPLFAALIPAMLVGNSLVRLLPPARRVLDAEAFGHPGASFHSAQRKLARVAAIVVPLSMAVSLLGGVLPW